MKRLLLLLFLFSCTAFGAMAQEIMVSGKVTSANAAKSVEGVTVVLKGTNRAVATANDGSFTITAPANGKLIFSGVGFKTKTVDINGAALNVSLDEDVAQLDAVVVTALGIQRQKKSLGYSTQQVGGSDLSTNREVNVANALAGKVAGLVINRGTSGPGSSTRLQLRGDRSVQGLNQPLYVIDGVPMDNTIRGGAGEFNGSDGGDVIGNIPPDDIENISVLKGPNAAALYGARAANGVVLITTKKGRSQRGLGITYSLNYANENPTYKLKFQDQYAQGDGGTYTANSVNSWGPKITGQGVTNWLGENINLAAQDHTGPLFQNGSSVNNALSVSAGNEKSQIRLSGSNERSTGLIPGNKYTRSSFLFRGNTQISSKLSFDAKVNYIYQNVINRPSGGEEAVNPYSDLIRMPTTVRNQDLQRYDVPENGKPRNNFFTKDGTIINNPYWIINNFNTQEVRNRFITSLSSRYLITEDLSVQARVGLDKYFDNNDRKVAPGSPTQLVGGNSLSGDFSANNYNSTEINVDALITYAKKINKIGFSISGGSAFFRKNTIFESQSAGGLDIPYLYVPSNGKTPTSNRATASKEIQSVFGSGQISYNDYLFVDVTARNDWSSTLPTANRSYFYPSVSLSAIVSEMVKLPTAINYAKVRASFAKVGKDDEQLYSFIQTLVSSTGVNGVILANNSNLVLKDVKPEQTSAIELGTELRFLNNRLTVDLSYYKTNSRNQILRLPLPLSSLFSTRTINAGNIQNSGFEMVLGASPVKQKDFEWNISINYAKNKNKVIELTSGLDSTLISTNRVSDLYAKVGDPLGNLYVRGFERNAAGRIVVGANGLPLIRAGRPLNVGNYNPDWTGGITNTFRYKAFTASFLIDARVGGKIVSHTQAVLAGSGLTEETIAGRDGNLIIDGDLAGGGKNTTPITSQAYWSLVGGRGGPVGEAFTYSATNVRLRQLSIGYRLPSNLLKKTPFTNIDFTLSGRNLFFLKKTAPFDPEVALNNGLGGQGIDFWSMPTTRSIGFNINVSF
jgi:TonB-linked SusC/RagA family outer membrane protein